VRALLASGYPDIDERDQVRISSALPSTPILSLMLPFLSLDLFFPLFPLFYFLLSSLL
jgi:hypothetical protein